MRKPLVGLAGIALLVSACTTTSQSDPVTEAAPPETAQATTVTTLPPSPSTTSTTAAPTTTVAPPTSATTTVPPVTTTTRAAPAATTTTAPPGGTPILTEPAAAPDAFSASVVGGTPITIPNNAQDVTISVDVVFQPDGYCETFFLFAICGWDFHETPAWPGDTFTPEGVSVFTATETLPFPSSEGDTKIFYFTYGYGEFLGLGDTGNQTIAILVQRESA